MTEYQKGEFCKAMDCTYYGNKQFCKANCCHTAYEFHNWLIEKGNGSLSCTLKIDPKMAADWERRGSE